MSQPPERKRAEAGEGRAAPHGTVPAARTVPRAGRAGGAAVGPSFARRTRATAAARGARGCPARARPGWRRPRPRPRPALLRGCHPATSGAGGPQRGPPAPRAAARCTARCTARGPQNLGGGKSGSEAQPGPGAGSPQRRRLSAPPPAQKPAAAPRDAGPEAKPEPAHPAPPLASPPPYKRQRHSRPRSWWRRLLAAMFAVKRNAVIGLNLYCGGGGPGLAPASQGSGPAPPPAAAAAPAEVPRALTGSAGAWAAAGRREPPRTLIGCGAAPRALIGCAAAPAAARPAARWSPEEELDGCEPEADRGPAGDSLPGTPPGPAGPPDGLRQESLELISRYLREAAGEAEPGAKKLFPGLLGGPGRPSGSGDAVMEKALETLRRVGDGVMQKHELAFQGEEGRGCLGPAAAGGRQAVAGPGTRFPAVGDGLWASVGSWGR